MLYNENTLVIGGKLQRYITTIEYYILYIVDCLYLKFLTCKTYTFLKLIFYIEQYAKHSFLDQVKLSHFIVYRILNPTQIQTGIWEDEY